VVTRYACGTTTENKVFALRATDLSIKWVFNAAATHLMDYGTEGCVVDYARNIVICGTEQPTGQDGLWAISTLSGSLAWSHNAGAIVNRPTLNAAGTRLYVGTKSNGVKAYDPTPPGSLLWTYPLVPAATVTRNISSEFRSGSPGADRILVTDSQGVLRAIDDLGSSAALAWQTRGTVGVTTMPVVSPAVGKVYVGLTDGKIHQVNWSTGEDEVAVTDAPSGPLSDPTISLNGEILLLLSGETFRQYLLPWGGTTSPITEVEETPSAPPARLSLDRVAPNPFNPRTQIDYSIPVAGKTSLAVYDVRGHLVARLVDEVLPPGRYRAFWDGRDAHGRAAASGIYIARLQGLRAAATRKLVLAK